MIVLLTGPQKTAVCCCRAVLFTVGGLQLAFTFITTAEAQTNGQKRNRVFPEPRARPQPCCSLLTQLFPSSTSWTPEVLCFKDCGCERPSALGCSSQADRLSDKAQPNTTWDCIQIFDCQFLPSREHKCLKLSLTITLGSRIPPHNSDSTLPNKPETCCFCLPPAAGGVNAPACVWERLLRLCSGCPLGKSVFAKTHQASSSC